MRALLLAMAMTLIAGCGAARKGTMTSRWYDFRFGGERAGWFEVHQQPGEVAMDAVFEMDGKVWENPFGVRYAGDRITAYRSTPDGWKDAPADRYPTSAYPLLVPKVRDRLTYQALNEGSGEDLGPTELVREGDQVTETRGGKVIRRFRLDPDGTIRWIDWGGGATSELVSGEAEAKAGLEFAE